MARSRLIARAGKSVLDFFALLARGVGTLVSIFVYVVLFAWANEDSQTNYSEEKAEEIDGETAKSFDWDSY